MCRFSPRVKSVESGQGSTEMWMRSSCSHLAKLVGDGKASPRVLPPPPPTFSYSSFLYGDKTPEEKGIFFGLCFPGCQSMVSWCHSQRPALKQHITVGGYGGVPLWPQDSQQRGCGGERETTELADFHFSFSVKMNITGVSLGMLCFLV